MLQLLQLGRRQGVASQEGADVSLWHGACARETASIGVPMALKCI